MRKTLLLGAGFSSDLGMPLTGELTEVFLNFLNDKNLEIIARRILSQEPFSKDRPINERAVTFGLNLVRDYKMGTDKNYETLIANVQAAKGIEQPTQSDRDSLHYLALVFYEIIHGLLCLYHQASYEIMYEVNKRWFASLRNMLSDEETWVFTLNHDLYVEYLSLDHGIPISYGHTRSIPFPIDNHEHSKIIDFGFHYRSELNAANGTFIKGTSGINLVKLHGGLTEHQYDDGLMLCDLKLNKKSSKELNNEVRLTNEMAFYFGNKKVGGLKDRTITNSAGELDIFVKSMLTGNQKYSSTSNVKKGEEKLQLLDNILKQTDKLTIIGYGFGDKHINFRLSNAFVLNDHLRATIVDPMKSVIPECLEQFNYDSRVIWAKCDAANWMDYSKSKKWNVEQMDALKKNVKYREDVKQRVLNQLGTTFQ